MYQFGLSPVTAEVPSMSAVALGANRWASRVVVVLQLAAWSAVGIVLLQKGVSSLQKTPVDVRNLTKTNYTETSAVANLMMRRLPVEISGDLIPADADNNMQNRPGYNLDVDKVRESKKSVILEYGDDIIEEKSVPGVIPLFSLNPNRLPIDKKQISNREKNSFKNKKINENEEDEGEELDDDDEELTIAPTTTSSSFSIISTEKYDKIFESRKKNRMSNLSGGGAAAAAIAMVAVGAVMLVLGPIVIILRALDERRQERRFLKLSGQDDPPPSYEQATLMDEAPRYSTLSLNTISCSPGAEEAAAAAAAAAAVAGNCNNRSDSATAEIVRES